MRSSWRLLLALVVGAALAFVGTTGASAPSAASEVITTAAPASRQLTVTKIVDGDTLVAAGPGGSKVKIRMLGIDTPETKDPRKSVQCWGPEATQYAEKLLRGQRVTLVADPTQEASDRYGRALGYVLLLDGRDYSTEAARAGTARAYVYQGRPVLKHEQIAAAQHEAQAAHRGLWGACPA